MNDDDISEIVEELSPLLVGQRVGKIFQLSRESIAIDFHLRDGSYLFLSVEPQTPPRLYLIKRKVSELEKQTLSSSPFVLSLYKRLSGARLLAIKKDEGDRIVRFSLATNDLAGNVQKYTLVAQLTGRSSNILLLDKDEFVIDSLRTPRGEGHEAGIQYAPPDPVASRSTTTSSIERDKFSSLSEAADSYYQTESAERLFNSQVANARSRLKKEVDQKTKLRKRLLADIESQGDADSHKRLGELITANLSTAIRRESTVSLTDYYSEGTPRIELEIDEHISLKDEAARYFSKYAKARRASEEIARRLDLLESELNALRRREVELERVIADHDQIALVNVFLGGQTHKKNTSGRKKSGPIISGARRYLSSDGFEILVGRAARDNDHLTFKIAKPNDLWLHAADYPGSHVIVLNPVRKEIPHRTVIEAAQLAAKFSQARRDGKVDVHYTQRKFIAKPKGAAPGLVRMSTFRSIVVEPRDDAVRL